VAVTDHEPQRLYRNGRSKTDQPRKSAKGAKGEESDSVFLRVLHFLAAGPLYSSPAHAREATLHCIDRRRIACLSSRSPAVPALNKQASKGNPVRLCQLRNCPAAVIGNDRRQRTGASAFGKRRPVDQRCVIARPSVRRPAAAVAPIVRSRCSAVGLSRVELAEHVAGVACSVLPCIPTSCVRSCSRERKATIGRGVPAARRRVFRLRSVFRTE